MAKSASVLFSDMKHRTVFEKLYGKGPEGRFLRVPYSVLGVLDLEEAVFLSLLINHGVNIAKRDVFWITNKTIQTTICASKRAIRRLFKSLVDQGFIQCKMFQGKDPETGGYRSCRYVEIVWSKLTDSVNQNALGQSMSGEDVTELRSMPYSEYLKTDHWRRVRKRELKSCGGKCRLCNRKVELNIHHRTYERRGCEEPNDVLALCYPCHEKFHDIV